MGSQWLKITKKSHFDVFKKSPKLTIFGNFDELFSTQNVNVARFARNFECDFLCDFQTLCSSSSQGKKTTEEMFVDETTVEKV